jgi:AcrR family transcriptional regulator
MRDAKKTKVLEAAQSVFFRYGYRRTTMGDLASAAGISRPALYLLYCNKEDIFAAVLRTFMTRTLAEIHEGLAVHASAEEKLRFAFDVWAVRPFGLLMTTPDAKELIDCGFEFAREAIDQATAAFEAELTAILAPLHAETPAPLLAPDQIARILTRAVHGFKESAQTPAALQAMIDGLLGMVLGSLRPSSEAQP